MVPRVVVLYRFDCNYSRISGILWQYCREEPALVDDGAIADFTEKMLSYIRLKFLEKITCKTGNNCRENVKVKAPLN